MEGKQFVNLLDAPYSRRGSYIAFANDNYGEDLYGKCSLWLCNCRTIGFAMANQMCIRDSRRRMRGHSRRH